MGWLKGLLGGTKDSSAARPPAVQEHPRLGRIRFDEEEGWWTGRRVVGGFAVEFYVDGGEDGPRAELADDCLLVLSDFPSYWHKALRLAQVEAPKYGVENPGDFSPTEIWGFGVDAQGHGFTMSLSRKGDSENLWRVQFDGGEATHFGRDT